MGFETLKQIIEMNKLLEAEGREEAENPTHCPYDWWPLNENKEGEKSCPICGRIFRDGLIRR